MPGTIIEVKWPTGRVIRDHMDQYKTDAELLSTDPNDHYRPSIEKNVGKQGWDWDWKIGRFGSGSDCDTLFIKMRKGRDDYATIAKLKWM